ncbi:ExbD/TolR family protein [Aureliella helgolandensis]|uniref:Biopolymer transport protein ExbD n=1 Tax=Aureliella helgolandensis TaxID=2527968 RepID=A0A518G291_9BACT|nr:biopolymer transporter ExbD [Aureliella helgolandensis]QDV22659.1 biopolymer transport protein ExbD [Aureliella helgolandensis]
MPLKTSRSDELPAVNLTPMIDVVFLLIIFFMVGTQFSQSEQQIGLKLPGAGQLKTMIAPPDRREVVVTAEGAVLLDGQNITPQELTRKLEAMRARYPDLRVVVRADGKAEHQFVAAVYGAVNRAGVADLSIAVRSQAEYR